MLRLVLSFLFATSLASASPAVRSAACSSISTTPAYFNCYVDLTVGIDMSLAMGNTANIATLDNSLLSTYFTNYATGQATYTSVIAFGASSIQSSDYFTNYGDLCAFIHSAEAETVNIGLYAANLSQVFITYRDNQLHSGRNYQKVFVVFTAITDTKDINATLPIASQVRNAGAQVVIVALNTTENGGVLSQLGDQIFTSPDFTVSSSMIQQIVQTSCTNSGSTYSTMPLSTTTPSNNNNDLGNAIGSPCAMNKTNAWLDVVLVVDVSAGLTISDLQKVASQLATIFEDFTIGQNLSHTTRVGIVTYSQDVQAVYSLSDVTDLTALIQQFFKLSSYRTNNLGGNLPGGLKAAQSMLGNQNSYRRQAVVMMAATYDPSGINDANQTATNMKQDGITIFGISYNPTDGVFSSRIRELTSPGYYYRSDEDDIITKISFGLLQVNCFCPQATVQFTLTNSSSNTIVKYGDCLLGSDTIIDPFFAPDACGSGIVVSVTSSQKLDFIIDNIIATQLVGKKNFTVGATLSNGIWNWYNYNNTQYPFGTFPPVTNNDGKYGYFNNYFGFNWKFVAGAGGSNNAKGVVCQYRACDTDFFCNLNIT